jgi:hypothetical protein
LLALELIVGRRCVWLPQRWNRREVGGGRRRGKFASALLRQVRWVERLSHPHLRFLFGHRLSGVVVGILVLALTLAAFLAPPFSGLDTLPVAEIAIVLFLFTGAARTDVAVTRRPWPESGSRHQEHVAP